jgi:hypothetical protein
MISNSRGFSSMDHIQVLNGVDVYHQKTEQEKHQYDSANEHKNFIGFPGIIILFCIHKNKSTHSGFYLLYLKNGLLCH